MIVGFRHKALRRFFESGDRSRLPPDMVDRIGRILSALHAARSINEIASMQSLRLHRLQRDMAAYWAVTVRANWRIVFRVVGDDIDDVDFMDYH